MAKRLVYIPDEHVPGVKEIELEFEWFPGFSIAQKQKSILSLHEAAARLGHNPILEISTKSVDEVGVGASAFNLSLQQKDSKREVSVESAFQGSKVFASGGPFQDIYEMNSRDAKREIKLRHTGPLLKFCFFGRDFPLVPRTFFYDWLYINTLNENEGISEELAHFAGFSDIEFNPEKSINCQAFSAALFVSLVRCNLLKSALESEERFLELLRPFYENRENGDPPQRSLI